MEYASNAIHHPAWQVSNYPTEAVHWAGCVPFGPLTSSGDGNAQGITLHSNLTVGVSMIFRPSVKWITLVLTGREFVLGE